MGRFVFSDLYEPTNEITLRLAASLSIAIHNNDVSALNFVIGLLPFCIPIKPSSHLLFLSTEFFPTQLSIRLLSVSLSS